MKLEFDDVFSHMYDVLTYFKLFTREKIVMYAGRFYTPILVEFVDPIQKRYARITYPRFKVSDIARHLEKCAIKFTISDGTRLLHPKDDLD